MKGEIPITNTCLAVNYDTNFWESGGVVCYLHRPYSQYGVKNENFEFSLLAKIFFVGSTVFLAVLPTKTKEDRCSSIRAH